MNFTNTVLHQSQHLHVTNTKQKHKIIFFHILDDRFLIMNPSIVGVTYVLKKDNNTGSPRYMRSFYIRFRVSVIG